MSMARGVDERLVILDIDEKSLGELGRWPWSRQLMAELVDKLFERYGVAVLGFDVVWAEPDSSSGMEVLDWIAREVPAFQSAYAKLRPGLDFDARFAAGMKGRQVVLGYYLNGKEGAVKANALRLAVLADGNFEGRRLFFPEYFRHTRNLAVDLESASGAGHINPLIDFDGVVRRVPLVVE